MINIHDFMYDQNPCVNVESVFMTSCMIRIHVLMYDQNAYVMYDHNSCVNV
jgi:hypothetical protein